MSQAIPRTLIRGARLFDPGSRQDQVADLYIEDGRISAIGRAPEHFKGYQTISADGYTVIPGITDLMARPGGMAHFERELEAAAAGGITALVIPPDISPVLDNTAVARLVVERAARAGRSRVHVLGALTTGLAGSHLTEMHALSEAGCIGMSNMHYPVQDQRTLLRCLEYAATCSTRVFFRPVDVSLAGNGCAHQGQMATRLGLRGIPYSAETVALARDLLLVEQVGVSAHFGQISCARSVELLAEARARGLSVTADVAVHHLLFDENNLDEFNTQFHVNPPLRAAEDRAALLAGLRDGVIQAICSDHRPLDSAAKHAPFAASEPGMAGLETLLGAVLALVEQEHLSLECAVERLTTGPARIVNPDWRGLEVGAMADLCVYDPATRTKITAESLHSHGKNSPLIGHELPGRVVATMQAGRVIHPGAEKRLSA